MFKLKTNFDKLWEFFNTADLTVVKILLALGSILWGAMMLFPGDSFARPMFSVVNGMLPESLFGALFLVQGSLSLYFYSLKDCKPGLLFLEIVSSMLWTGVTFGMVLSSVYMNAMANFSMPIATAPSIILTLASLWILIRCPKENITTKDRRCAND